MATSIQVFDPSAARPSFAVKGALSEVAKALAGGGDSGKRISIKGGVFRLLSGGKEIAAIEDRFLDVVIVNAAAKVSRTFYAGKYEEGASTAPSCWSADGNTPDVSVKAEPASTCATCPNNVKGSGQGDSRACSYSQRLAVVLANDVEGDVMQLTLPAMSIFGKDPSGKRPLQEYVRFHGAQGDDVSMMVTRMNFDTSAAVPKLFFKAMRWLTTEEYEITAEQGKHPDAIKAITMTVLQQDGVAAPAEPAAPALAGPKPTVKPKAAPVVPLDDDEIEDEPPVAAPKTRAKRTVAPKEYAQGGEAEEAATPEPVVRKAAPAAKPAAAPTSLASVLDSWDDEE